MKGSRGANQRLLLWMCNNIFLSVSVNAPRMFPLSRVRISQHLLDTLTQTLPLCDRINASGKETGWVSASPLDLFIFHMNNPPSAHLTWLTWLFEICVVTQAWASLHGKWPTSPSPPPSSQWTATRWHWRPRVPLKTQSSASSWERSSKRPPPTTGRLRWEVKGPTCAMQNLLFRLLWKRF